MALLTRARASILTGVAAITVTLPMLPAVASPAAAAPVSAKTASTAANASVTTYDRKKSSSRAAARARTVMAKGGALKGVPYRYGGSTPRGFDCSGYTSYVYRKAGTKIPRTASAQRAASKRISRSQAIPGDLVFFHRNGRVYHVGLYAGKGKVLHAPRTGRRVSTERIWTSNVSYGRP